MHLYTCLLYVKNFFKVKKYISRSLTYAQEAKANLGNLVFALSHDYCTDHSGHSCDSGVDFQSCGVWCSILVFWGLLWHEIVVSVCLSYMLLEKWCIP